MSNRFLNSVFEQRTTKPKYFTIQDVTPVLNYLEDLHILEEQKLEDTLEKVTTLLALTIQRLKYFRL